MLTESQRREVHTALEDAIGQRPASLMMDALAPVWNDDLARRSDINRLDAKFDRLEARFDRVDAKFELIDAKFERMEAKIDAQLARLIQANVLTGIGIAGLVLAAAKLT